MPERWVAARHQARPPAFFCSAAEEVVKAAIPSLSAAPAAPPADRSRSVSSHIELVVMLHPSSWAAPVRSRGFGGPRSGRSRGGPEASSQSSARSRRPFCTQTTCRSADPRAGEPVRLELRPSARWRRSAAARARWGSPRAQTQRA
eukprot:scaffold136931_cov32-Tisochrysis_lutea.AAC.5